MSEKASDSPWNAFLLTRRFNKKRASKTLELPLVGKVARSVLNHLFNGYDVSDPTWMAGSRFGSVPDSGILAVLIFFFPINDAF